MNKEVAKILKDRLLINGGLAFADVVAGMVQTVTYEELTSIDNSVAITKRMPVSTDTGISSGCDFSKEKHLIPDSSKKGIVYFEDNGLVGTGIQRGRETFRSTLTLVCWLNVAKFNKDIYAMVETAAITQIIEKLKLHIPIHVGSFINFSSKVTSIHAQDANIFSRYTYNEALTQYLRPPFTFFALNIQTTFSINPNCVDAILAEEETCY